jgi:hypothetical protein
MFLGVYWYVFQLCFSGISHLTLRLRKVSSYAIRVFLL